MKLEPPPWHFEPLNQQVNKGVTVTDKVTNPDYQGETGFYSTMKVRKYSGIQEVS